MYSKLIERVQKLTWKQTKALPDIAARFMRQMTVRRFSVN